MGGAGLFDWFLGHKGTKQSEWVGLGRLTGFLGTRVPESEWVGLGHLTVGF